MKAIDLYSGVGGWSLGLAMAGVEVVASYEWWPEANETNFRNNGHKAIGCDMRRLDPSSVPKVDMVVGSPPCTHFSLANRGGRGDIFEGLKDVEVFLEVVSTVKPRFWALENVPRLAAIFLKEMSQGGLLHRFAHLSPRALQVDASEWGVPQRRSRVVIGNFDEGLLLSYRSCAARVTLGDVVASLSADPCVDPVYGLSLPRVAVTEHVCEEPLSREEERINRDCKESHPVYNGMRFPDDPSRPARTVTATCTRVSRESIVVAFEGGYRRPTLRENACLQSFPINYQFYGRTHAQKQKMVGNAIPPVLAYYVAHAMMGTPPEFVDSLRTASAGFLPPSVPPPPTTPDRAGRKYPDDRKFRGCIPGLRFKSGMRFELANECKSGRPEWEIKFFFGDSKNVRQLVLGPELIAAMKRNPDASSSLRKAEAVLSDMGLASGRLDQAELQGVWTHRAKDHVHPHDLLDLIAEAAERVRASDDCDHATGVVSSIMDSMGSPRGHQKVIRHAKMVFVGAMVGSIFNVSAFRRQRRGRRLAKEKDA